MCARFHTARTDKYLMSICSGRPYSLPTVCFISAIRTLKRRPPNEQAPFNGVFTEKVNQSKSSPFYEWDGDKRKFRFSMPGAQELYMAGIYDTRGGVPCYSILTTAANESMREVHDRMPLVLEREQIDPWLYDLEATSEFLHMTPPQLSKEPLDAQVGLW